MKRNDWRKKNTPNFCESNVIWILWKEKLIYSFFDHHFLFDQFVRSFPKQILFDISMSAEELFIVMYFLNVFFSLADEFQTDSKFKTKSQDNQTQ